MKSFLDMEILARGAKVDDDTSDLQVPQPVPQYIPQSIPQIIPPVLQVDVKAQDTYESSDEFIFWEEERSYEIHVTIGKKLHTNGTNKNRVKFDSKSRRTDICIACFLIDGITKVTTEGLEKDTVKFAMQCSYYDEADRQEQSIKIMIDEDMLSKNNLVTYIRNSFGSRHTPFLPIKSTTINPLLSKYIIDRFRESPKEEYIAPQPILNDISDLSDIERKAVVRLFYKIYHNATCEMELLLSSGFGAVCHDKLEAMECENVLPNTAKTIIVYGCKSNVQQSNVTVLAAVSSDKVRVIKLSETALTSKRDELKEVFFNSQYQPVIFIDDEISDYAKKQNIAKIQRITEYVNGGIQRDKKADISCSAVIFTNRKLSEFKALSEDCIFVNAENIPQQDYIAEDMQYIITNFLSLLYQNIDYTLKKRAVEIRQIADCSVGANAVHYEIYRIMVKAMFDNYGIGNSDEDIVLNRCLKKRKMSVSEFMHNSNNILSDDRIMTDFVDKINRLIMTKMVQVSLYDKSLTASDKVLLYEHMGEPVLLFSNKYFESLFTSYAVNEKGFREILDEYGYIINNYPEKCNFRMPKDERKLYVAVKTAILNDETSKLLPNLHPVYIPDLNDGISRVYLADDEHGNPIYWPVGKLENRSVLVKGNTRMGKTYFTTTKLIMGLHRLGCRVLILESAMPSYSIDQLNKCGYNEEFVSENFSYGKAVTADEIMSEFEQAQDSIYIVSSDAEDSDKQKMFGLLFRYQRKEFEANLENTRPLFIVFEEAGDTTLYDAPELKRLYNQGSKMKLSVITILQMFMGKGSQNFRRMVGQASLKISFKCSTDHIKYFTDVIPPEIRDTATSKLPMLGVGEAIICGDFEQPDGSLYTGGFIAKR